jgi:hypothetical protein
VTSRWTLPVRSEATLLHEMFWDRTIDGRARIPMYNDQPLSLQSPVILHSSPGRGL